ncbi:MAG: hypothetical protein HWE25_06040 [Alphaproteobacteria bacterium]|nr:hypothetical protein [Alphaproteobacteria bacterium]
MLNTDAKLEQQFSITAYINIGLIAVITILATFGVMILSSGLDRSETVTKAMRNHMFADMMHDGIRADVYNMYQAAVVQDRALMNDVADGYRENAANFRQAIAANEKLDLPEDIQKALRRVHQPLDNYLREADKLISAMNDNFEALDMKEFEIFAQVFDGLIGDMEGVSESIETLAAEENASNIMWARIGEFLIILAGLGSIGFSLFLRKHNLANVVMPVSQIANVTEQLSEVEDTSGIDVPYTDKNNEIGQIAKALVVFKETSERRREEDIARAEEDRQRVAEEREREIEGQRLREQMEQEVAETQKRAREQMAQQFEEHVSGVVANVLEKAEMLKQSAQMVGGSARDTAQKSRECTQKSESAGHSVQTVASGAEEMTASIGEINSRVTEASSSTRDANKAASNAVEQVDALDGLAQRVGEVVKLINDIAEQTNLLALNATIEAARAGDAGKGFAVVASEVKSLANQTGKATQEIENQIEEMQAATRTTIEAVRNVTDRISNIDHIANEIAAAVHQQSAATSEIGRAAASASDLTITVSENIDAVGMAAQANASTMETVEEFAVALVDMSSDLQTRVRSFVADMRG